jgi:hypothetical protein
MNWLLSIIIEGIKDLAFIFVRPEEAKEHPVNADTPPIPSKPQEMPIAATSTPTADNPTVPLPKAPELLWDTPKNARHSVRVICDQERLTYAQKDTLCATVGAESGWKPRAVGKPNSNGSRDWGICQINDSLWIGVGKTYPSTDYVLNNPEKCIRWMCYWWKKGKMNWWIAFKNGSYKRFL